MKRDLVVAVLFTFCLIATLCLVVPESDIGDYVPWFDVNDDGKTDIKDIAIVAKAFGSYPGFPNWNSRADITGSEHLIPDSKIDIRDLAPIAVNYGEEYS